MNKFHLYHSLIELSKSRVAEPLLCPECRVEYVCTYDDRYPDEPVFECYVCGTKNKFGLRVWTEIERIVRENIDLGPATQA